MFSDDKQFIERLTLLARHYGWTGDYIEIQNFVEWAHKQYGLALPDDLEPLDS